MAMAHWLQAVTDEEAATLRRDASSIDRLDTALSCWTHLYAAVEYFAAPLKPGESVTSAALETGWFHLLSPDEVAENAERLAKLDMERLRAEVARADFDALIDEHELYELELLQPAEAPDFIADEVERLAEFYAVAAGKNLGVAFYIT
ncbi:hypothetical protein BTM25_22990 [Actinomadura rubteroloni]|uniref:DUF1877 family protein n=1 Tax=Actinomadura rubteroloni TaxID=1926885 RepID=A0A2P4US56_9ACTN|nr:DUF1877 family protein [Actinomadura rubteroloni]POM27875.1 hypothetical protein BTM25_22990 [Actinomadura rubteroloni]